MPWSTTRDTPLHQHTGAWHSISSCQLLYRVLMCSWRNTTLSLRKKLTSSTANLEWCHVHFSGDSYSTSIRRVNWPGKNSMELFFNATFDFKSTWNRDWDTSHHKHLVCKSFAGDSEKLINVWSRYFGTTRIIENWHWCLGVMWRKQNNFFDE